MILTGQLLLEDGVGRCRIAPGWIRIDQDRIAEVVEGEIPSKADFGGRQAMISPGFIDAHLHLPQFDMMGAHGMPLLDWLSNVTFPAELKWEDVDFARAMTKRVVDQLVAAGTTGICAYATVHHQSAIAAIEVAAEAGMRGVIGQVLMNRNAPTELCRDVEQLIHEAGTLGQLFPASSRMAAAVTPRFAVSCCEQLLAGAGDVARQQSALIQTHLAETRNECEVVRELFGGLSYLDVYREAGLLTERTVFGHGIHLDAVDRTALAESHAKIAHCPTANSFLRSGTMSRVDLLKDKVELAIGSDIGAGYERSMVRVGRAMIEAASSLSDHYPAATAAWHAITAGNADALGWSDAGRLRAGDAADVLVIEPDIAWLESAVDPLSMLMFAWDDRWLKHTFLRGSARI